MCSQLFVCVYRPGLPPWLSSREVPSVQETQLRSLDQEDSLGKGMATHSTILAWRIPWAKERGGSQFMGLQTVGQD